MGTCAICGGISHESRRICNYCMNVLVAKSAWRNDLVSESLTCPWCGEEQGVATDALGAAGVRNCDHCGGRFAYELEAASEYASWRLMEDMPSDWPAGI